MLMYCIDCGYKEDRVHFIRDEESMERRCPSCKGINCFPESEVAWCDNCCEFPVVRPVRDKPPQGDCRHSEGGRISNGAREGLWCKKCVSQDNDPNRFTVS
ncbi:MAG: hypothetical protein HYV65_01105 [Candidatus Spechtbacteria bacterium]|nr:hypothetical protein [Candidatus Spechtbacteria bacterium]